MKERGQRRGERGEGGATRWKNGEKTSGKNRQRNQGVWVALATLPVAAAAQDSVEDPPRGGRG